MDLKPYSLPTLKNSLIDITLFNVELNKRPLILNDNIRENLNVNINAQTLIRDPRTQEFVRYSPTLKRGFIRLSLADTDFYHQDYQNVLIRATVKLADDPSSTTLSLPNQPYTPATNTIRLDYASNQRVYPIPEREQNAPAVEEFFYLFPFTGYKSVSLAVPSSNGIYLFPQYIEPSNSENRNKLANGNLYIGLENLKPGSNLSLLILIQEGSEKNPDVTAPIVSWSYLAADNEWKPLSKSNILKDTTIGLRRSGIVQVSTPRDMVQETTLFRNNCYWLRATIVEEVNNGLVENAALGLPSIIDIRAQAILVEFENNENELDHLGQPLPANTITQLQSSRSAVRGIEQPISSFNGRLPEMGNMFFVRISERLRHRDRAVAIYDYERLLLEQFPKIQRAKCLNHTKPGPVDIFSDAVSPDIELAPGYVSVSVIPRLDERIGEAAAEPRFSQGDLEEMATYLRGKTNLFVASQDLEDPSIPYLEGDQSTIRRDPIVLYCTI